MTGKSWLFDDTMIVKSVQTAVQKSLTFRCLFIHMQEYNHSLQKSNHLEKYWWAWFVSYIVHVAKKLREDPFLCLKLISLNLKKDSVQPMEISIHTWQLWLIVATIQRIVSINSYNTLGRLRGEADSAQTPALVEAFFCLSPSSSQLITKYFLSTKCFAADYKTFDVFTDFLLRLNLRIRKCKWRSERSKDPAWKINLLDLERYP